MLKQLQQRALQFRLRERRQLRSDKLSSLEALLQGQQVDPRNVEPLSRQQERARLMNRVDLVPELDGAVAASRRIFEVVVGGNDTLPRNFLEDGARTGNAVCRVIGQDESFNPIFGTALAVAPGLILTNNHVLPTPQAAALCQVEFGFWTDQDPSNTGRFAVPLDPRDVFVTDIGLDFTLVSLDPRYSAAIHQVFGAIDLLAVSGKALLGESVNIIHHGGGGPQQLGIRNNIIVDVFDHWIHYTTDTMPGASGAPVLNDQWQLAALHHASVEQTERNGRVVVVNEGVRISSIYARLLAETD